MEIEVLDEELGDMPSPLENGAPAEGAEEQGDLGYYTSSDSDLEPESNDDEIIDRVGD